MNTVRTLLKAVDAIAPLRLAASWDNVGLLVGHLDADCTKVLVCIDLTRSVLDEARAANVDAIVAYHPLLFDPRTSVTDGDPIGQTLLGLIEAGIAVVAPHTALDAAPGGMTDWLASGLGEGAVSPLTCAQEVRLSEAYKIMTYVPREHIDGVRTALTQAGAGKVGDYDMCTVTIDSTGTFRGGDGSKPVLGTAGTLECVDECTLMAPCSQAALAGAIAALQGAHPYEEPPVHIVPLAPRPLTDTGSGRLLTLHTAAHIDTIAAGLRAHLGVDALRLVTASKEPHTVIGCCPGAGGSMLNDAMNQGATLFVTGEMRHHELLNAKANGVSVLLAGHTNTERGYMPVLCNRLGEALDGVHCAVSRADTCPWVESRSC
jgi:dinuclear metal center YbgI/SA1388 family protein